MHSVSPFTLSLPPSSAPRVPHAPHLPLSAPKPVQATVTTAPRDSRKARLPGRGRPCGGPAALGRGESARGPAWGRGRQQSRGARCQARSGQPPQLSPAPPGGDVTGGRAGWAGQPWTTPEPDPRNEWGCRRRAGSEGRGRSKAPPTAERLRLHLDRGRKWLFWTGLCRKWWFLGLCHLVADTALWAEGLGEGHLRPPSAAWLCHVPAPIPQTLSRPKGQRWD